MKKLLGIVAIGLMLSGCVEPGHESSTLSGVIMVAGIIVITIVLSPFVWAMGKLDNVKNPKLALFLWIILIISIIFVMINMGSIFAFVGRTLGFGN